MTPKNCPQCGAPLGENAVECEYCGERFAPAIREAPSAPQYDNRQYDNSQYDNSQYDNSQHDNSQHDNRQYDNRYGEPYQPEYTYLPEGVDPSWPVKSKVVAALLAIFLGSFGAHKFYLGKIFMGILYLLFCWTWIPGMIGFFEGIVYLCSNDVKFQRKHKCRLS